MLYGFEPNGQDSLLTFEGKARVESRLKEREEIETLVLDGGAPPGSCSAP